MLLIFIYFYLEEKKIKLEIVISFHSSYIKKSRYRVQKILKKETNKKCKCKQKQLSNLPSYYFLFCMKFYQKIIYKNLKNTNSKLGMPKKS